MREGYRFVSRPVLPLTIVLAGVFLMLNACQLLNSSWDIVIKNGRIIDGTGNPPYRADLAIKGGKIVKIGSLQTGRSKKEIDAAGLYVVPGFIDVHTHVDRKIAAQPALLNYLLQGVTTVIGGNCGGFQYPLQDLYSTLEKEGIALNFASLVGHNTVRREIMGSADRVPTPDEMARMQALVREGMRAGAIGFSTGLSYVPGRYSTTEEIIDLVKMVQPFNGIYATHLRNQGRRIKEAIEEAVRIGREAGVSVEISHIKLSNEAVWGQHELITGPIEAAQRQGLEVYMDQYPYTATSSGFSSSFPGWAVAGGNAELVKRIDDPENFQRIKESLIRTRLTSTRGIDRLQSVYVSRNDNHPDYEGKNLAEILDLLGRAKTAGNGAELIMEMQRADRPRGVFFQMAEDDVEALMRLPYNMIASDGKVEVPGVEVPHPRAYGTFPRVLGTYVREHNVLSLPDAIRKMTSLPAQAMHLYGRGVLREGLSADVVIFDPDEIQDAATFADPHQYPRGINWVIVNGVVAVDGDGWTEALSGQVLRSGTQ